MMYLWTFLNRYIIEKMTNLQHVRAYNGHKNFFLRVFTCDAQLSLIYSYNKEWITFSLVVCTTFMQPDKMVLKLLFLSRRKKSQVLWFGIHVTHSLQLEKVIKLILAGLVCCLIWYMTDITSPDWWYVKNMCLSGIQIKQS